ncbi:MAG: [Firmicutes bacterium]|nr:[citrate (pro-3S)-lyase] ligase [Bacillota bacterium]MBQ3199745.1 [citrate (pro-3S)-lyase] ligase [Bacillota bacterium]
MTAIIKQIPRDDEALNKRVDILLQDEGIQRDGNLDYTCGVFDDDGKMIATGSCFDNTLRCLAVDKNHRRQGYMKMVIAHLKEVQSARGNTHLFLYTKVAASKYMASSGFYEIARVADSLVFMENTPNGFADYCADLAATYREGKRIAGIVMNANPFTNGHKYLVETAAAENDVLHLFILSEDAGPIPFAVRRMLVHQGVAHLPNVVCHDSGPYIISSATFPSYFLKDGDLVIRTQAALDLQVFGKLAKELGIQRRYVGQELTSHVTSLYNQTMEVELPKMGIEFIEIKRKESDSRIISASTVRKAIHDGCLDDVKDMLPPTTYAYFAGPESAAVRAAICAEENVIHY